MFHSSNVCHSCSQWHEHPQVCGDLIACSSALSLVRLPPLGLPPSPTKTNRPVGGEWYIYVEFVLKKEKNIFLHAMSFIVAFFYRETTITFGLKVTDVLVVLNVLH